MEVEQIEQQSNGTVDDVIDAPRFDKDSWLRGATDLEEAEVFVSDEQGSVKVRSLSAGQLATIQDQCLVMKGDIMKLDTQRMAVLKFKAGVIEPKFTESEANVISMNFGQAFSLVVSVIDEISRASEEDVAKAKARFRPKR